MDRSVDYIRTEQGMALALQSIVSSDELFATTYRRMVDAVGGYSTC